MIEPFDRIRFDRQFSHQLFNPDSVGRQFIDPNQLRAENVSGVIRIISEISQTAWYAASRWNRSPNFLLAFEAVRVQRGTTFSPMKVEGVAKPCKTYQTIAIAPR